MIASDWLKIVSATSRFPNVSLHPSLAAHGFHICAVKSGFSQGHLEDITVISRSSLALGCFSHSAFVVAGGGAGGFAEPAAVRRTGEFGLHEDGDSSAPQRLPARGHHGFRETAVETMEEVRPAAPGRALIVNPVRGHRSRPPHLGRGNEIDAQDLIEACGDFAVMDGSDKVRNEDTRNRSTRVNRSAADNSSISPPWISPSNSAVLTATARSIAAACWA